MALSDILNQRFNDDPPPIRVFNVGDSFDFVIDGDNHCEDRRHFVDNHYEPCTGKDTCIYCKKHLKVSVSYVLDAVRVDTKPLARGAIRLSFKVAKLLDVRIQENPLANTVYRIGREEDDRESNGRKGYPRYIVRPAGRIPAKLTEKISSLPPLNLEKLIEEQYAPRDSLSGVFSSSAREYDRLPGAAVIPQSDMTPEYEWCCDQTDEVEVKAEAEADAEANNQDN
jgi:hypothetical protein